MIACFRKILLSDVFWNYISEETAHKYTCLNIFNGEYHLKIKSSAERVLDMAIC